MSKATGGKPSWLTRLIDREAEAVTEMVAQARIYGPLRALRRVSRGELGGPVSRYVAGRLVGGNDAVSQASFYFLVFAGPVAIGYGLLAATDGLISGGALVWQIVLVLGLIVLGLVSAAVVYLLALRPTRGIVLQRVGRWGWEDIVWWSLLMLALPTVAFAAVSALLVHQELLGVNGVSASDSRLSLKTAETFLWNFCDAIPVLKVPQTLNWEPAFEFTTVSGAGPRVQDSARASLRSAGGHRAEAILRRTSGGCR